LPPSIASQGLAKTAPFPGHFGEGHNETSSMPAITVGSLMISSRYQVFQLWSNPAGIFEPYTHQNLGGVQRCQQLHRDLAMPRVRSAHWKRTSRAMRMRTTLLR